MDFEPSPRSAEYRDRVSAFIDELILPLEARFFAAFGENHGARGPDWRQWRVSDEVEALKAQARDAGLWNLFLPIAEAMGRSLLAPEIFNCNAPDTGNMEVLWKYGSDAQRATWLTPLLAGEIRSAFCMTEPEVASSDATNMRATATLEGDEVVIDGRKWWATGLGHPRCRVLVFMGLMQGGRDRHHQHGMVLVPIDTPGVRSFSIDSLGAIELSHCFPEFRSLARCKYRECSHIEEPGCAVKAAMEQGEVSKERYRSYLGILKGVSFREGEGDNTDAPMIADLKARAQVRDALLEKDAADDELGATAAEAAKLQGDDDTGPRSGGLPVSPPPPPLSGGGGSLARRLALLKKKAAQEPPA